MSTLTQSACAVAVLAFVAPLQAQQNDGFTRDFPDDECRFTTVGGNAYFPLLPGLVREYDNDECIAAGECDEQERLRITVTHRTKNIEIVDDGRKRIIPTRIVEEREWQDGRLTETSQNYFAACGSGAMRDVYYFGEAVDVFEYLPNGQVKVTHPGQWLAGKRKAEAGLIMPGGAFLLGARYYQEMAPGMALDRAEHTGVDLEFASDAGEFDDCVAVIETTPLEPGNESHKLYCPRAGLAIDNDLVLRSVTYPGS